MNDDDFMRLAIEKAREGILRGHLPFGACIARAGKVLALAHNTIETGGNITEHAETNAIRLASKAAGDRYLNGCTMYATCEPCPMCFGACHLAGIGKVVYAASIRDGGDNGFGVLDINNLEMNRIGKGSMLIKGGLLREESLGLFRLWKKINGGRAYISPWQK